MAKSVQVSPLSSIERSGFSNPSGPEQKSHWTAPTVVGQQRLCACLYSSHVSAVVIAGTLWNKVAVRLTSHRSVFHVVFHTYSAARVAQSRSGKSIPTVGTSRSGNSKPRAPEHQSHWKLSIVAPVVGESDGTGIGGSVGAGAVMTGASVVTPFGQQSLSRGCTKVSQMVSFARLALWFE